MNDRQEKVQWSCAKNGSWFKLNRDSIYLQHYNYIEALLTENLNLTCNRHILFDK